MLNNWKSYNLSVPTPLSGVNILIIIYLAFWFPILNEDTALLLDG